MKSPLCLALVHLLICATVFAQSPTAATSATNSVQLSQPEQLAPPPTPAREMKIPAGTPLEVEVAYTVSSLDVRPEELISFRVIVPIRIDGQTVIERNSLVTGRVAEAKRGQHWGRAGKLSWIMQDVVVVDLTRVPIQAQRDSPLAGNGIKGTSHGGQVATEMIVLGGLLWAAAPLVLMHGFKRGENAVLPEGKRFVVYVQRDTIVKLPSASSDGQTTAP